jgi:hypothetical protein
LLNKLWHIHQMEYNAVIKYNEVDLHAYVDWYRKIDVLLN